MCGIAGIIGHDPEKAAHIGRMLAIQRHRGPDKTAIQDLGHWGILGHNRLRIIDLHANADQPFCSPDGRFTLVFNGEIYNYLELKATLSHAYSFKTQSDTEVLLAAFMEWGSACLDRLIGMFSFAIWDNLEQRLFAARDRFGVKPFYFASLAGVFLFASEIKTLWAAGVPRHPDERVWAAYFAHGAYGQPDATFWESIRQLPGGHMLTLENGTLKIRTWYNFVQRVQAAAPLENESEIREKWLNLAQESIQLRFRADVPIGFNVSGGLDSSLLLGLVQAQFTHQTSVRAFTFYTGDDRYDELYWAQEMMSHSNFPHSPVRLAVEEVPALSAAMSKAQDEPFGGIPTLAYGKIFEAARSKNTIVLLDGQGLDEAWAGYDYYLENSGALIQGSGKPAEAIGLQPEFASLAAPPVFPAPFRDAVQNLQFRDLFWTKLPRALRFNDRASMLHSTELREPFLDHRLVEMAFALPMPMKIRLGQQKWLLRRMAGQFLPENLALAPKRPVQTPQREWLAHDLHSWVAQRIEALVSECPDWFDAETVCKAYDAYSKSPSNNSFFVWQWVNAGLLLT